MNKESELLTYLQTTFAPLVRNGLWPTSRHNPTLWHAHNNLLVALGLLSVGQKAAAQGIISALYASPLVHENGSFNYSCQAVEGVVPRHHSCTIGMAGYVLARLGQAGKARGILQHAHNSNMYDSAAGLYVRSVWANGRMADEKIITHSNLWIALAWLELGERERAKQLISNLEERFFDTEKGLLSGINCVDGNVHYFPDDNALYAIVLKKLGHPILARRVLQRLLHSCTYARVSTYKNHIVQAAFRYCGLDLPPYDWNQDDEFADSIALGLWKV